MQKALEGGKCVPPLPLNPSPPLPPLPTPPLPSPSVWLFCSGAHVTGVLHPGSRKIKVWQVFPLADDVHFVPGAKSGR